MLFLVTVPLFEPLLACLNTFAHLQQQPLIRVAMPSPAPSEPPQNRIPEAAEILRLKRKLAVTHQELDEARGSRPKKIPWVLVPQSSFALKLSIL
jgi:hypothetical protein